MSASAPTQVSASTTIDFRHNGSVQLKLSTESEQFPEERLESILDIVNEMLSMELHLISHDCPRSPRRKRNVDPHELTLTVSNVVFTVNIELTVGMFDIPPLNVYTLVEQSLYAMLLLGHRAIDVENKTGIPVDYRRTQLAREAQQVSDALEGVVSALGFNLDGIPVIRI